MTSKVSIGSRPGSEKAYIQGRNGERKFIGGADMARRVARGKATRILRPGEKQRVSQVIPRSLSPFERFFAGLLRSEATDYMSGKNMETWRSICERLGLPVPEGPLKGYYGDAKQHFAYRAALVMEESRYAISEGVMKFHRRQSKQRKPLQGRQHRNNSTNAMQLTLTSVEQRDKSGNTVLNFAKVDKPFTNEEVSFLRQGTVFACLRQSLAPTVQNAVLGCVLPGSREEMIRERVVSVIVFNSTKAPEKTEWELVYITSLLTEQRKFDACTTKSLSSIPFLLPLLGGKKSTHTRFHEDDNGDTIEMIKCKSEAPFDGPDANGRLHAVQESFRTPRLNRTQEKAAAHFLRSEPNSITLIQGPPGTGKTTLLVSIVCRYVAESIHGDIPRSLLVCAPTNKAVSVLCTRFLNAIQSDQHPCNIVLVGDDDKLLDDDYSRNRNGTETSNLRSIFLYTWVNTVMDDYLRIRRYLASNRPRRDREWIHQLSLRLESRIRRTLSLPKQLTGTMSALTKWLELDATRTDCPSAKEPIDAVCEIIQNVKEWKPEQVWQEILGSAHIIFCTLASSGASILKRSVTSVNDLIVDEAAAATEPEMYIPFHFRPERLLAVGDPKQLPATVVSQIAEERGLSRSLHERLMYDCNYNHIMLNIQYRMRPSLCQFPSKHFYSGKLKNGPNVTSPEYAGPVSVLNGQPYSFLQVGGYERQGHSGSYENQAEANAVVELVEQVQRNSRRTPGKWHSADRIRIITFYQAQVNLIKRFLSKRRLRDVVVATVDSSQGCEADIVIVSFVRSPGASGKSTVGFLSDDRRMNVAITRAKYQLICVGNAERMAAITQAKAATVKSLATDALDRKCVLPSLTRGDANQPSKRPVQDRENEKNQKKQRTETTRVPENRNRTTASDSNGRRPEIQPSVADRPRHSEVAPAEEKQLQPLPQPSTMMMATAAPPQSASLQPVADAPTSMPGPQVKDETHGTSEDHGSPKYTREELLAFLDSDSSSESSSDDSSVSSSSSSSSAASSTDDPVPIGNGELVKSDPVVISLVSDEAESGSAGWEETEGNTEDGAGPIGVKTERPEEDSYNSFNI